MALHLLPRVILFVSDTHFGRLDPAADREAEQALVACMEAFFQDTTHLFLMGDVFEAWIEHAHLVPRPPARFFGALARWADAGRHITVFAGNHDPWHRSYFRDAFGATLVYDALETVLEGRRVYLHHGDGLMPRGLYRHARRLVRHPLPVWLYKHVIPADWGLGLARWVSRKMHGPDVEIRQVEGLRAYARRVLTATDADAVVMGHSHHAECTTWPEGVYLNPGAWYRTRTFGVLDEGGFAVLEWKEGRAVPYEAPLHEAGSPHV